MRKVVCGIDKNHRVAGAEGNSCQNRPYPVQAGRDTRPGKPELSQRSQQRGDADDRHHGLRWRSAGFRIRFVTVDDLPKDRLEGEGERCADTDPKECQPGYACLPATNLREYNRICDKT